MRLRARRSQQFLATSRSEHIVMIARKTLSLNIPMHAERRLPLLSRRDGDASIGGVGRRPLGRLLVERGGDERDGEAGEPLL